MALGRHDCGLMLADWVVFCGGPDPAASVRGRYATEDELMALAGPGGLPRLFDRLLRGGGLRRVRNVDAGDVAIVSIAGTAPRGALRNLRGFVLVAPKGVSRIPAAGARVIQAWRMPWMTDG